MMINEYNYNELREKALSGNQDDINVLGEWFCRYGERFWNGEYYDADGVYLYPVLRWDDELDQGEIIGYEVR